MHVAGNAPGRIDFHPHIGHAGLVEDPAAQSLFDPILRAKLRHDHERRGSAIVGQFHCGPKHLTRYRNATLHRLIAAVWRHELYQRSQSRVSHCGQPHESRAEVRSIVVEISAEERGHEKRDDGDRPMKARQLRLKPEIRLVGGIAVDCQIRVLRAESRGHLRRNAFLPREPLPEHYRFAREEQRRTQGIHRLLDAAYTITGCIERVVNGSSADRAVRAP